MTGGFSPQALVNDTWVHDTVQQTWRLRAPLRERRYSHKSVVLDGKILVGCGMQCTTGALLRLSHFESYDPATDVWVPTPPLQQQRFECAMEVYRGRIFVAGGRDQDDSLASVEIFDPVTQLWAFATPMPEATTNVSLAILDDVLYLVVTVEHTQVLRFDLALNAFVAISAAAPVDIPCPATFGLDGSLYLFDTFNEADFHHGTYTRFYPATNTWTVHHAGLLAARNAHTHVAVHTSWSREQD
jgi:hypothetical protein